MAKTNYVTYKNFLPERLNGEKIEVKKVFDAEMGKEVERFIISLKYTYDNGVTSYFEVEYPELLTRSGVRAVNKKTYSTFEILAETAEELPAEEVDAVMAFAEALDARVLDICSQVEYGRRILGDPKKTPETARLLLADRYYSLFFKRIDEEKNVIEDSKPRTKFSLADFPNYKTSFLDITNTPLTDPETGRAMPFHDICTRLDGTGFTFVPRVSYNKVEIGKTSARAKGVIKSLMVTNFREGGSVTTDMSDTSAQYLSKYGTEHASALSERFRTLQPRAPAVPAAAAAVPQHVPAPQPQPQQQATRVPFNAQAPQKMALPTLPSGDTPEPAADGYSNGQADEAPDMAVDAPPAEQAWSVPQPAPSSSFGGGSKFGGKGRLGGKR